MEIAFRQGQAVNGEIRLQVLLTTPEEERAWLAWTGRTFVEAGYGDPIVTFEKSTSRGAIGSFSADLRIDPLSAALGTQLIQGTFDVRY